jgi:dihydrofolate reductase
VAGVAGVRDGRTVAVEAGSRTDTCTDEDRPGATSASGPHGDAEQEEIAMGELVVTEFVTLDGVAQAPGGPEEDNEGAFAHGGWQGPLIDEQSGAVMYEQAQSMDALLLGRKTYDIFASYWPNAPEEIPFTGLLNRVPKYVASRTLTDPLSWGGSSVLAGDLAGAVAAVKERHDRVHVIGSLDLVQTLLHAGLVDRLDLWVYPVLLGSGKRVFAGGTVPAALRLAEATTYPRGTVQLIYELTGVPTYADMAEQNAEPARLGEPG